MNKFKPELLAPAGNLEKAFVAFLYGADAVYIAGERWGLRKGAGNFTLEDIEKLSNYANLNNKRVYVVINIFAYDEDINGLEEYLMFLDKVKISAIIFSDPSIFNIIKKRKYNFEIHLSTQANLLNYESAKFWKKMGVERFVLAREVSIKDANVIANKTNCEVEMFLHGSMCMSFSGKCMISNFTANRDANRGGCVQSCRWNYKILDKNNIDNEELCEAFPLNSRDLSSIKHIKDFFDYKISSLKIEGRMKSNFYIARTVSIYREAIDKIFKNEKLNEELINKIENVSNRGFNNVFLDDSSNDSSSIRLDSSKYISKERYLGIVLGNTNGNCMIRVKNFFENSDNLFILLPDAKEYSLNNNKFFDLDNEEIIRTKPNTVVLVKTQINIPKNSIVFSKKQ